MRNGCMVVERGRGIGRLLRLGTILALRFAGNDCTLLSGWMACGSCEKPFFPILTLIILVHLALLFFLASTARATSRCTYWLPWLRFCKSIVVGCDGGLSIGYYNDEPFKLSQNTRFVSGRAKCMNLMTTG